MYKMKLRLLSYLRFSDKPTALQLFKTHLMNIENFIFDFAEGLRQHQVFIT